MISTWADYSGGRPAGHSLPFEGVFRYVGIGSAGKRLTLAELDDLSGAGIEVRGVVESTTTRDDAGEPAGVADAQAVLADPTTSNLPFIYMTNDKSTFTQADVDYASGFQSVLGERAGGYGFGSFLLALMAAGIGHSYWQAGPSPSRTGTTGKVHFWQRQGGAVVASDGPTTPTTQLIAGVSCDLNNRLMEESDMSFDLTSQLPDPASVAGSGSVAEALCTVLYGIGGKRNGGTLANAVAGISSQLTAAQSAIIGAIPASSSGVTDVQVASIVAQLVAAFPTYQWTATPVAKPAG